MSEIKELTLKKCSNFELLEELLARMKQDKFLFSIKTGQEEIITVIADKEEQKGLWLKFYKNGLVRFDLNKFNLKDPWEEEKSEENE